MAKKRYSGVTSKLTISVPECYRTRVELEAESLGLTPSEYAWVVLMSAVSTPDSEYSINTHSPALGLTHHGKKKLTARGRKSPRLMGITRTSLAYRLARRALEELKHRAQQSKNPDPPLPNHHKSSPENSSLTQHKPE